tara:strand:+ start:6770 stop:7171 length:402 start_codon:yes stop_codon:yes gene_type:complete
MSSIAKNISNTTSTITIPKFLVKLGKIGVENGKLNIQMKKNKNLNKKIQKKTYNTLLKEVHVAEKEAIKVKKDARKAISIVLNDHYNNIKMNQPAETLKKQTIKVITIARKNHPIVNKENSSTIALKQALNIK